MATKKQIEANRRNAQKSCGPKSPETKAISSQNRLKHGLAGEFNVLACESQQMYERMLEAFLSVEQPANEVEHELVVKMVRHTWLSARALRLQEGCFTVLPQTGEQVEKSKTSIGINTKDLEIQMRYMSANDRGYARAAAQLAKLQNQRRLAEIGFEREKRATAEDVRREKRQNQRDERHQIAVAIDKKRYEGLEADVVLKTCKASAFLERSMAA